MASIQVNLSAESEAQLKKQLARGHFKDAGEILAAGLRLLEMKDAEKTAAMRQLRDELEKDISKPNFTVEEYDRYLDNVSALDDETKQALLDFELEEAEAGPDAEPGVFDRLREYIHTVAREKAKCQPTN